MANLSRHGSKGRAVSRIEVLFRGSSDNDGVQSRGAGWHLRTPSVGAADIAPRELAKGLSRGDLVRQLRTFTARQVLLVRGERRMLVIPSFSNARSGVRAGTRKSFRGDGWLAWESSTDAADLLEFASMRTGLMRLSIMAAMACAESVPYVLPTEYPATVRALRAVHRWAANAISRLEVDRHEVPARIAFYEVPTEEGAKEATAYAAYYLARAVNATGADLAQWLASIPIRKSTIEGYSHLVRRSMAFLIRVHLPTWQVCLAFAEEAGTQ